MSATIDTLGLAKRLQETGFTREQAEGLAAALFGQPAQLVTVPVLDQRLDALQLDARFRELEHRLALRFSDLEKQLQQLFIRLGGTIFGAVLLVSAIVHFWK